jgi:sporulation protein YqfC
MRRISHRLRHWTARVLELPQDVVFDLPRLTMIGDRQLYIENHRGVLHFSPDMLRLRLPNGRLEVSGKDLVIRGIWTEEVLVEGVITQVSINGQEAWNG